jgi:post-segregation antitoxin (ccd killing protein)
VSTLGSKLRAAGVNPVIVHGAERMTAQLEQEKSAASYWQREADKLRAEIARLSGEKDG